MTGRTVTQVECAYISAGNKDPFEELLAEGPPVQ